MSVLTSKPFGRWASSPFQGLRRPAQPEYSLRESLGELEIRFQQGRGGRTTLEVEPSRGPGSPSATGAVPAQPSLGGIVVESDVLRIGGTRISLQPPGAKTPPDRDRHV